MKTVLKAAQKPWTVVSFLAEFEPGTVVLVQARIVRTTGPFAPRGCLARTGPQSPYGSKERREINLKPLRNRGTPTLAATSPAQACCVCSTHRRPAALQYCSSAHSSRVSVSSRAPYALRPTPYTLSAAHTNEARFTSKLIFFLLQILRVSVFLRCCVVPLLRHPLTTAPHSPRPRHVAAQHWLLTAVTLQPVLLVPHPPATRGDSTTTHCQHTLTTDAHSHQLDESVLPLQYSRSLLILYSPKHSPIGCRNVLPETIGRKIKNGKDYK